MSKIIIGIHGLGNKPPKELLEKWWLQAICEGLTNINQSFFVPQFEMVYWADILNDKPLNPLISDKENPYYISEKYLPNSLDVEIKPKSTRKKFLGFLEQQMDKLFLNDDLSPNFEFISDIIFKKYFKELDVYYSNSPINNNLPLNTAKKIIRNRLVEVLKKHADKEIFLIGHSMGSIIAYDVCNFETPETKINTFVTIGSPLGMQVIMSKIAEELRSSNKNVGKIKTPKSIKNAWYNFSDIDDNVALNYNLHDDFHENEVGVKVKDVLVTNNYYINDERNPHKSYGYLRAKEFSLILSEFLLADLSMFELWKLKSFSKLKNLFKKTWFKNE